MHGQESYTLSGTIKEAASNESMINANVYFPDLKIGVSTNKYGFYSIKVPGGTHRITVSSIGFQDYVDILVMNDNLKQDGTHVL
ncbi:carboxypeptidase-like regulatory domain-containing protein [Lutimonas sp.]|uniref:carboxypeptidase-like regulatory domain-containing protein n=1 Tax=Lutimonas sp. TaxID=1872403 RepID=UPI003D9B8B11